MDALHSKMANMEDSLQSSQLSCSQLQEELGLCKQQRSIEINVIKEEVEILGNEVYLTNIVVSKLLCVCRLNPCSKQSVSWR